MQALQWPRPFNLPHTVGTDSVHIPIFAFMQYKHAYTSGCRNPVAHHDLARTGIAMLYAHLLPLNIAIGDEAVLLLIHKFHSN